MRARFVLACAAAGIAASAAAGTIAPANAGVYWDLKFSNSVVNPGDAVDLFALCADKKVTTAKVASAVLDAPDLRRYSGDSNGFNLISHAKVKTSAKAGEWQVSFQCGRTTVTENLTVAGEPAPPTAALFVEPAKGVAGSKVEIEVICTELQPVTSAALEIGSGTALSGGGEGRPYFEVTGKVKNVKPGTYKVSSTCDGKPISTSFTVLAAKPAPQKAQVPVKPKKAPETGGGDA